MTDNWLYILCSSLLILVCKLRCIYLIKLYHYQIVGMSVVPNAGDVFTVTTNEAAAREVYFQQLNCDTLSQNNKLIT